MLVDLLAGVISVCILIKFALHFNHFPENPAYSQVFIDCQKQYDTQYVETAELAQSAHKDDLQDIEQSDYQDTASDQPQFAANL